MLDIFNELAFFFTDNNAEIGVREYARKQNISAPTAAKKLRELQTKGLLKQREFKRYLLFRANKENKLFTNLQITYYAQQLQPLIQEIQEQTPNPLIILFGSTTKAQRTKDSDIDIAIISQTQPNIPEKLTENLQVLWFADIKQIKNHGLLNNIQNGYRLAGEWTGKNAQLTDL